MKVAVFSTKIYDRRFLETVNTEYNHELFFLQPRLDCNTASLASGFPGICVFVNDTLDRQTLEILHRGGTRLIAFRCAGYNNIDLETAAKLNLTLVNVPAYSPYAVAEHTVALILTMNRKIHRAYNRVREGNFSLDGLLGFDLHGRTVGVVGTGRIGRIVGQILRGFGCQILAYDLYPNQEFAASGVEYVDLLELVGRSDIITLHCPLTPETKHLINEDTISHTKPGVMVVNTSRGALIDTEAIITGLKSKQIGYLAIDVYEEEKELFFEDLSNEVIQDDVFQRLLTFPNVLITGHQAFFTADALQNIAETTLSNIREFEIEKSCPNQINLASFK